MLCAIMAGMCLSGHSVDSLTFGTSLRPRQNEAVTLLPEDIASVFVQPQATHALQRRIATYSTMCLMMPMVGRW